MRKQFLSKTTQDINFILLTRWSYYAGIYTGFFYMIFGGREWEKKRKNMARKNIFLQNCSAHFFFKNP